MKHHTWRFQRLDWPGSDTRFFWKCESCGSEITTETHYAAGETRAYLHAPEWKPRIGWEYDCNEEAARLVHES